MSGNLTLQTETGTKMMAFWGKSSFPISSAFFSTSLDNPLAYYGQLQQTDLELEGFICSDNSLPM